MDHFERANFADYITQHGVGARISGKTVREIFGSPSSMGNAWLAISGLPDQESTSDAFNRYLEEHLYVADYNGPDDVFILHRLKRADAHTSQ